MRVEDINVGDRLVIREWDDMAEEYGMVGDSIDVPYRFTLAMKYLCGIAFTVGSISSNLIKPIPNELDLFDTEGRTSFHYWSISAGMCKPYQKEKEMEPFSKDELDALFGGE